MDIALILTTNYAGTEWSISGNDYATLEWYSATTKPTEAQLATQWPSVDYSNQVAQVAMTRRLQYEAQSDGLFFEWQRGTNTQAAWETAVDGIKQANPYPPAP